MITGYRLTQSGEEVQEILDTVEQNTQAIVETKEKVDEDLSNLEIIELLGLE